MRNFNSCFLVLIVMTSCGANADYSATRLNKNLDGMMDTLLPFFARLHDSIPTEQRFSSEYKAYMDQHKKENDYRFLYYAEHSDSFVYVMISRKEASIKNDKLSALCARYRRDASGRIDTSGFEELFWTWKMKREQLIEKSEVLFSEILKNGNVDKYLPENSEGEWVEFPGNGVYYDRVSHIWLKKPGN